MARRKSFLGTFHKAARIVYRANRASRTAEALASGNPRRIVKLEERRLLYRLFARFINRVLK